MTPMDPLRRRLLAGAGVLPLVGCATWSLGSPAPESDPFLLGVASGEPSADGFVIWTRLATAPVEDESGAGGMPPQAFEVEWTVAEDPRLRKTVQTGRATAEPDWGHSVHVEVGGLLPDRPYWYGFRIGRWRSPTGRARTIAVSGAPVGSVRFAFASCQNYEAGYYAAYRDMVEADPDLILHLGDYIYEANAHGGIEVVRAHASPEPRTLAEYRRRHAQYRLDPQLQAAHAHCPWLMVWDDHDVRNDYAGLASPDEENASVFAARRAAAYQAWWEHMPLRLRARPANGSARLYHSIDVGGLLRISMCDTRQYRDDQPCGSPGHRGGQLVEGCKEALLPGRTMLGAEQEAWLADRLRRSPTSWNLVAQTLLFAPLDQKPGPGEAIWTDGWDGMPAARQRLLRFLADRAVANPVVIGGDIHSFWANDLRLGGPGSEIVATEFTGTSISSPGVPYETFSKFLPDNPHVRYFESRFRGYALCEVERSGWRTTFRGVDDVRNADSAVRTLAAFHVEPGMPGVQAG